MLHRLSTILGIPRDHPQHLLFGGLAVLGVLLIWLGIGLQAWWLLGIPLGLAVLWLAAVDFRKVFFLMLASIPLSIERELPGGFATDLPSEPLMWVLTLCGVGWLLQNLRSIDGRFIRHPLTIALLVHLCWIAISVVTSQDLFVSFKYLLAKGWYVIVFYCLAAHFLHTERDFKAFFWWFLLPLLFAVMTVFVRHAAIDFSFQDVAYVMGPFFRNHVMYACLLAIFLPFIWYATYWYKRWSATWWFLVGSIAFPAGSDQFCLHPRGLRGPCCRHRYLLDHALAADENGAAGRRRGIQHFYQFCRHARQLARICARLRTRHHPHAF